MISHTFGIVSQPPEPAWEHSQGDPTPRPSHYQPPLPPSAVSIPAQIENARLALIFALAFHANDLPKLRDATADALEILLKIPA